MIVVTDGAVLGHEPEAMLDCVDQPICGIGASLWELPPGEAAYPYHYHLAEEPDDTVG